MCFEVGKDKSVGHASLVLDDLVGLILPDNFLIDTWRPDQSWSNNDCLNIVSNNDHLLVILQ